jgi:glc operon protein GlcG
MSPLTANDKVFTSATKGDEMSAKLKMKSLVSLAVLLCSTGLYAQLSIPYGESVTMENVHKVVAPALAEAAKNHLHMAIAIVDVGGELIYFEKMDGTQTGSVQVAIDKARSAVLFRRPTKFFEDALAAGGDGLRFLGLRGAVPVDGGFPLVLNGKIVGAIGMSGGTNKEDGQCAFAGATVLK